MIEVKIEAMVDYEEKKEKTHTHNKKKEEMGSARTTKHP